MNALNSFPSARDKTIEQKWNKTVKDTNKRKTVYQVKGFCQPTGTNGTLWKWIRNEKNDKMSERNKTVTWCRDTIIHNHSSQWNPVFPIIIISHKMQWKRQWQWQWLTGNDYSTMSTMWVKRLLRQLSLINHSNRWLIIIIILDPILPSCGMYVYHVLCKTENNNNNRNKNSWENVEKKKT